MDTLVELQVETDLTKMARFLNSLPPRYTKSGG